MNQLGRRLVKVVVLLLFMVIKVEFFIHFWVFSASVPVRKDLIDEINQTKKKKENAVNL